MVILLPLSPKCWTRGSHHPTSPKGLLCTPSCPCPLSPAHPGPRQVSAPALSLPSGTTGSISLSAALSLCPHNPVPTGYISNTQIISHVPDHSKPPGPHLISWNNRVLYSFFFLQFISFILICMGVWPECMSVHTCNALRVLKSVSEPLEPELQF